MTMRKGTRLAGWAAAGWAALFAGLHLYWVLGGRLGLGERAAADEAFGRAWFVGFNLLVAAACVVATLLALATVQRWGRTVRSQQLRRAALWTVTAALLARGVLGVMQSVALSHRTAAEELSPLLVLYDPWFVLGGLLFGILAERVARDQDEATAPATAVRR